MNPREVARAARRSIDIAHERLRLGDAVLVFAEGTRSRTHGMQQTLAAVARYFDGPARRALPIGITGTEALFPVDDDALHVVPITARIGPPIDIDALRVRHRGDRRGMMDEVGRSIAALLPLEYRGVYAGAGVGQGNGEP
jgi:1-acyl-sn-glycerol-3-phosphate acyltransferase